MTDRPLACKLAPFGRDTMPELIPCGCRCGMIRFSVPRGDGTLTACHGTDCQIFSGGGPSYLLRVAPEAFFGLALLHGGAFDERSGLTLEEAIWATSVHSWHAIPDWVRQSER